MSTSGSEKAAAPSGASPLVVVLELFRAEKAADPHGFVFQTQTYVRRLAGGVLREATCPWEETLFDLVSSFSGAKHEREAARRFGEALSSFLRPLDWSRDEAAIERAIEEGRPVEVMLRLEAAELFTLPWELLTVGSSGAPLGELPHVTIRYQWPGTTTTKRAIEPPNEGGRVLFAWSAAGGVVPAEGHAEAIASASRAGIASVDFDRERDVLGRATYRALSEALETAENEGKPFTVLHLLCHGGQSDGEPPTFGLALDGRGNEVMSIIDGATLAALLRPHAKHLRLVVVSACQGADPGAIGNRLGSVAQELHRAGIEAVVASRFPLGTEASTVFSRELYRGLFVELRSVEAAFVEARRLVQRRIAALDHLALQLHAREADIGIRPIVVRPYRGLLVFDREHRGFLFGRDAEIREVGGDLGALRSSGKPLFLVVAGASGTGKSSLVRAGAVPAILDRAGSLEVIMARPSKDLDEVLRSVESAGASAGKLLVVDQFEEIFTHIEDHRDRESLVRRLWTLAKSTENNVAVVLTLRVDFIGRCGEITVDEGLRLDAVAYEEGHRIFVAQMGRSQLEETILKPADRVGLAFDDGLVRAMLEEVGEEPGALPLVEYALDQIWLRREGNRLTQKAYAAIGGVGGALQKQADALLDALSEPERHAARRLLVRLVGTAGDGSIATRRRVPVDELRPSDDERAKSFDVVLGKLSDARLLVRDWQGKKASVEVAHEALIRRWERLREWVVEDRKKLAEIEQVEAWEQNQTKFTEALLTGDALGYARQVHTKYPEELSASTIKFIATSEKVDSERKTKADAAAREKEELLLRGRRSALIWAVTLAVGLIGAVIAGIVIYSNKEATEKAKAEADVARDQATAKEKEATVAADRARASAIFAGVLERLGAGQPQWAARLLLADPKTEAMSDWIEVAHDILTRPMPRSYVRLNTLPIEVGAWSPDSKRFLTASNLGQGRIWDVEGKSGPLTPGIHIYIRDKKSFAWSSDGRRVVVLTAKGAEIWDVTTARKVFEARSSSPDLVAFSPDGKRIAISDSSTTSVWDVEGNGEPLILEGHRRGDQAIAFSPDGRRLATGSFFSSARIWDLQGKDKPIELVWPKREIKALAWSPDGARIAAAASFEPTARIWRTDGKGKPVDLISHEAEILDLQWNPDGERIITVSTDRTTRVWKADGKDPPYIFKGHSDRVWTGAFSPDGRRFLTSSSDGTARIWPSDGDGDPVTLACHEGPVTYAGWSPDGRRIITAAEEGSLCLWDVSAKGNTLILGDTDMTHPYLARAWDRTGKRVASVSAAKILRVWSIDNITEEISEPMILTSTADELGRIAFSPDGARIAMASLGSSSESLRLWNTAEKSEPITLGICDGPGDVAEWSPDGARIARTSGYTVCVWNTKGGTDPIVRLRGDSKADKIAWAPDGARIAVTFEFGGARVFRADGSGSPVILGDSINSRMRSIVWSPDGMRILTTSTREARVWDADGKGEITAYKNLGSVPTSAVFSRDGQRILITFFDGEARIVRVDGTGAPVVLEGHEGEVTAGAFSPDGTRVVTVSTDKSVRIWDVEGIQPPVILRGHARDIDAVMWSEDGDRILTSAKEGTVRVWIPSVARLKERLTKTNDDCLPVHLRVRYLGVPESDAHAAYKQCELEHGRTP